jgi:hypothetical protein
VKTEFAGDNNPLDWISKLESSPLVDLDKVIEIEQIIRDLETMYMVDLVPLWHMSGQADEVAGNLKVETIDGHSKKEIRNSNGFLYTSSSRTCHADILHA